MEVNSGFSFVIQGAFQPKHLVVIGYKIESYPYTVKQLIIKSSRCKF